MREAGRLPGGDDGVSLVRSKEEGLVRGAIRSRGVSCQGLARHLLHPKRRVRPGGGRKVESRSKVVMQGLAKEFTCCHTGNKKPPRVFFRCVT